MIYVQSTNEAEAGDLMRTAIRLDVPDVKELYIECGPFAGGLYGLRTFTYMRTTKKGTERVVVMNGRVVEHNETDCITDEMVSTSTPRLIGEWAWGLGLKKRLGFKLVQSQTLLAGLRERTVFHA